MQVGQLYVWGLLQWITPSSSTLQRWETASSLAWLYAQPMFIANTGGATGGLPVHAPPAASDQNTGHRYALQAVLGLLPQRSATLMSVWKCCDSVAHVQIWHRLWRDMLNALCSQIVRMWRHTRALA